MLLFPCWWRKISFFAFLYLMIANDPKETDSKKPFHNRNLFALKLNVFYTVRSVDIDTKRQLCAQSNFSLNIKKDENIPTLIESWLPLSEWNDNDRR